MNFPILEYDPNVPAVIEPSDVIKPRDMPAHCVICFFKEVIDKVVAEHDAKILLTSNWEDGPHPIYEIAHQKQRVAFFHPGIGAPLAAGLLDEVIAGGCRTFMVCGGCGVLEKNIGVGTPIVVTGAVRDEGVSYHYLPPTREIVANPRATKALMTTLDRERVGYRAGKTWTTDAPYRETAGKVSMRRAEGCIAVEMESAALMAVAEFRKVVLGYILYGGDDVTGLQWDTRAAQSRQEVRDRLFWLCANACFAI